MNKYIYTFILYILILSSNISYAKNIVLMTDFGSNNSYITAMKGTIRNVDQNIIIDDLFHESELFNTYEMSYRISQVMMFYPKGTIFSIAIDPGEYINKPIIITKTKKGHYIISPNNGLITHIEEHLGIDEVRYISDEVKTFKAKGKFKHFNIKELISHISALIASNTDNFSKIGDKLADTHLVRLPLYTPEITDNNVLIGRIDVFGGVMGNVWTNISEKYIKEAFNNKEDPIYLSILDDKSNILYQSELNLSTSFKNTKIGDPVAYINSVGNLAIALNQVSFVKKYGFKSGYIVQLYRIPHDENNINSYIIRKF